MSSAANLDANTTGVPPPADDDEAEQQRRDASLTLADRAVDAAEAARVPRHVRPAAL